MDPVVNKVFMAARPQPALADRRRRRRYIPGSRAPPATPRIRLLAYVGQRVIADMQNRLFRHVIRQDMALFQARHSGSLVSHFTYDINVMRGAVSNALVGIGRDSLTVIFLVGVMVYQDWLLSIVTLVVAPLTIIPIQRLAKRLRNVSTGIQTQMGLLTTSLSQGFPGRPG